MTSDNDMTMDEAVDVGAGGKERAWQAVERILRAAAGPLSVPEIRLLMPEHHVSRIYYALTHKLKSRVRVVGTDSEHGHADSYALKPAARCKKPKPKPKRTVPRRKTTKARARAARQQETVKNALERLVSSSPLTAASQVQELVAVVQELAVLEQRIALLHDQRDALVASLSDG